MGASAAPFQEQQKHQNVAASGGADVRPRREPSREDLDVTRGESSPRSPITPQHPPHTATNPPPPNRNELEGHPSPGVTSPPPVRRQRCEQRGRSPARPRGGGGGGGGGDRSPLEIKLLDSLNERGRRGAKSLRSSRTSPLQSAADGRLISPLFPGKINK